MPRLNRPRPISLQLPQKPAVIAILLAILLSLSACTRYASGRFQSNPFQPETSYPSGSRTGSSAVDSYGMTSGRSNGALPKGGGRRVLGRPYWMFGRRYVPRRVPDYDRTGYASWVSLKLHGNRTANGELEDLNALVAAHPTLPLPSYAEVTNLANGCRLFLRLNDRGPFVPGRLIDMSPRAAKLMRFHNKGVTRVRLRYWGPAPLSGDDSFERQYLRRHPDLGCRRTRRRSTDAPNGGEYRAAPYRAAPASSARQPFAGPAEGGQQKWKQQAQYNETYRGPTGVAYSGNR